jgi:hypothetical protein
LENNLAADKIACSEMEKTLNRIQLKVSRMNSIREVSFKQCSNRLVCFRLTESSELQEIISCDKYIDDVEGEMGKRDKANKAIQQSQDALAQCLLMLRDKETEEVVFFCKFD